MIELVGMKKQNTVFIINHCKMSNQQKNLRKKAPSYTYYASSLLTINFNCHQYRLHRSKFYDKLVVYLLSIISHWVDNKLNNFTF